MNLPLPSAGMVDPWQEILTLLTQKITFKGQPIAGTAEQIQGFARWMMLQMPGVVPDGDPDTKATCFLNWLRSEPGKYEADAATRMAQTPATPPQAPAVPPANPISDQTVAQQAQPVVAPAAPPAAPGAAPAADEAGSLACPECGAKLKNLTGMKRHCTMTHKADWSAIAQKHGLDISTGLKLGTAASLVASAQALPATTPPPPPSAAPVPPMFGAQGQAAAPPSFVAPGVPGQNTIPFTVPAMPQPPAQVAASPQAPMTGPAAPAFTPPTFAQAPSAPVAPPQPPPQPPAGPMVAFNPAQAAPVSFPAQPPPQQPQPSMGALFVGPGVAPPQQPQQGYATPQIPLQPVAPGGAPTRESMAQMLGGPVDLIVVRLLDAAGVNLQGRTDVNQLALLAEQRAKQEQKVVDLAQSAYGAGKQAAQRHFADLLTQHPGCYLLQNGYEPILPAGYLEILAARVTKFHIVTDSGRQTTTIF